MAYTLILLRHGQSQWNALNEFGGWADRGLTEQGKAEAKQAGEILARNPLPMHVYTSRLTRAIQTVNIALEEANWLWVDTEHTWRMNERHYGALQGRHKEEIEAKYGHELYMAFRRSLDTPPPAIDPQDQWSQVNDVRYAGIKVPLTESLLDMTNRIEPFLKTELEPKLREKKIVMVVGHGNSLRGLVRLIRKCSNDEIKKVDLKTGRPFVMQLNDDMNPIDPENWMHYMS